MGEKVKRKAETVFLVCEETGDHNYAIKRKPGGEKLEAQQIQPAAAEAHDAYGEEEVSGSMRWAVGSDACRWELSVRRTLMPKRWHIRPHDRRISRGWSARRGFRRWWRNCSSAVGFATRTRPDRFSIRSSMACVIRMNLPGLPAAADRLMAAIAAKRPIVVYGDYDADGMTATAILMECLRLLGATVSFYVPNRIDEGYGSMTRR
jgi:hypothetical protein